MRKGLQILALMLILALSVGSVSAQVGGNYGGYCGDLSEADCDIMTNITMPDSAVFALDGSLDIDVMGTTYNVGFMFDGSYITNTELAEKYMAMSSMNPAEVMDMMYADSDTFIETVTSFFQLVNSDMTVTLSLPEDVTMGMIPDPFAVDLWLVDGVGYADIGAFSIFDPTLEGVYGIDFVQLYADMFTNEATAPLLEGMFEDDTFTDNMTMFSDMSWMADSVTLTRLDDVTVDGQTAAVIESSIDYGALFASDAMRDMMTLQMEMQRDILADDPTVTEEDLAEVEAVLGQMVDMYAVLFDGTTLTIQYTIGLDDNYVHQVDMALVADMDFPTAFGMLADAMGEDADADELAMMPPVALDMTVSVVQSNVNTVETIDLPDNAEVLPMDLFGMTADM